MDVPYGRTLPELHDALALMSAAIIVHRQMICAMRPMRVTSYEAAQLQLPLCLFQCCPVQEERYPDGSQRQHRPGLFTQWLLGWLKQVLKRLFSGLYFSIYILFSVLRLALT